MHVACDYTIRAAVCHVCSENIAELINMAPKKHELLAPVSDKSVVFWELPLNMHTLCAERKLLLSLLSIDRSLGSKAVVTSK